MRRYADLRGNVAINERVRSHAVDMLCNFFNKPWLEFTGRTIEQELRNG